MDTRPHLTPQPPFPGTEHSPPSPPAHLHLARFSAPGKVAVAGSMWRFLCYLFVYNSGWKSSTTHPRARSLCLSHLQAFVYCYLYLCGFIILLNPVSF